MCGILFLEFGISFTMTSLVRTSTFQSGNSITKWKTVQTYDYHLIPFKDGAIYKIDHSQFFPPGFACHVRTLFVFV